MNKEKKRKQKTNAFSQKSYINLSEYVKTFEKEKIQGNLTHTHAIFSNI